MSTDLLNKRKIAVLGSRSVGKSSLVIQFVQNNFVESYYPTIEQTLNKTVNYNGVDYDCAIVDTAGQDEFTILNSNYAIGIHGYVLVYSVASRKSFDMIPIIYDKITEFCGTKVPCVIVGSKVDVKDRQVDAQEGSELADKLAAAHIETSARTNLNIAKVFELCLSEIELTEIEKRQPKKEETPAGKCVIM